MNWGREGYSVFEVLIAFAIMAMVLAVLIPGQARMVSRATEADDAVLAQDLAISRMTSWGIVRVIEFGETTSSHGDWQVIEVVTPDGDGLARITVDVLSANGSRLARLITARSLP